MHALGAADARSAILERTLVELATSWDPTVRDEQTRNGIVQALCTLLQATFPPPSKVVAKPYGSFISGFYTPGSDLDIALYGEVELNLLPDNVRIELAKLLPPGKETAPMALLDHDARAAVLARTANALCLSGMCRANYVERVLAARIPILKTTEIHSNVQVDVCCGLVGSAFKHDIIGRISSAEPRIKQLFRLVKLWAKVHGLNDGMNGTFNSWSLTLMVMFALQACSPALLPPMWQCFAEGTATPKRKSAGASSTASANSHAGPVAKSPASPASHAPSVGLKSRTWWEMSAQGWTAGKPMCSILRSKRLRRAYAQMSKRGMMEWQRGLIMVVEERGSRTRWGYGF